MTRQPGKKNPGKKSREGIDEREGRRAPHSNFPAQNRVSKSEDRRNFSGSGHRREASSGAKLHGNASRRALDAPHADGAVPVGTRARTEEPSVPTRPRQGLSPTLPVPRGEDGLSRRRSTSPATDHRADQQPSTPTSSTASLRNKSQPDGQQTIPPQSYASVVVRNGSNKTSDLATDNRWKLVQKR